VDEIKNIIAKNISELRLAKGMTQIELAEELNYSDKAVSKWERAESIPDISVLMRIAELFEVSLDYLVRADHNDKKDTVRYKSVQVRKNHGFITGISILLIWLIATFVYMIIDVAVVGVIHNWLTFIYAVPITMVVWLIFNAVWFSPKKNFLIISALMWTALVSIYLSLLLLLNVNMYLIFTLGVPGQIIIILWSKLK